MAYSGELWHYGVPGQKRGVRRYQNEDGSLTAEGRNHYGVGDPRREGISVKQSRLKTAAHNYRVRRFGNRTSNVLESRPQKVSAKQLQKQKEKRRKMIAAAAGITVAAIAAGITLKQYNKTSRNLIETAKTRVDKDYKNIQKNLNLKGQDYKNSEYWRQHDMGKIMSRHDAKKVLNLKSGKSTRSFIKNNNLGKVKTSALMEHREGKIVEGVKKKAFSNQLTPYSERYRKRQAEKVARRYYKSLGY